MMAAERGHLQCLSILLAQGAEVNKAGAVSVRGVCCIAYLLGVACIGVGAAGFDMTLFAFAVNSRVATQLSSKLLDKDTMNACQFCWLMVPKSI